MCCAGQALSTVTSMASGRVVLAATPLGRAADASSRLRSALAETPVIAAEDTRRLRRLCHDLEVTPSGRIVSFFDGNEQRRVPALLDALRAGEDVLVVSDAGMPSVSDPGYRLVAAAVAEGIEVTALPGPSAVQQLDQRPDRLVPLLALSMPGDGTYKAVIFNKPV